ncbi:MAG: helix-turn-helix domain-containing protein [Bacteroidota bacterium]
MKDKAINKRVGEHIRILRLSSNLSQEALADELEISVSTLSNLERGETEMTVARLYQILGVLSVDVVAFFENLNLEKSDFKRAFLDHKGSYSANPPDNARLEEEIRLIKIELERLKKL